MSRWFRMPLACLSVAAVSLSLQAVTTPSASAAGAAGAGTSGASAAAGTHRVTYKGVTIGEARLDLLVADRLVVELKACAALLPAHLAQVLSYLRTSGHPLALLINFNALHLRQGIKRVFRTQQLPLAFFVRSLVGGGP